MKFLIFTTLVLACLSPNLMIAQENPSVAKSALDKLHGSLSAKEPGWKITRKELDGNRTAYHWEREDSTKADVHIITTDSPKEAAATLQERMDRISVGPTAKLKGIGDEAYIYISPVGDIGIVRFRKGNLFIVVSASKSAVAKKISEDIAAALP